MKLRLYHHHDGARVAYRETGTGPPLALLHSAALSHKEWEPLAETLGERFRLVLPDLPLHGDSEQRPRHPYTREWFVDVLAGFSAEVLGPRPLIGGHDIGAELLLDAVLAGRIAPGRIVLMPNRMHGRSEVDRGRRLLRIVTRGAALPGLDLALSHVVAHAVRPELGPRLTARGVPEARDLLRHAFADMRGNASLARAWARFAAAWPMAPRHELLDAYARLNAPVLLLWADRDPAYPLALAEEALARIPDAQLRIVESAGYLLAYDDPVSVAREITAFCG